MSRVTFLALLLAASLGLRVLWEEAVAGSAAERLLVPFASFPLEIAGPEWKGEDVPLPEEEKRLAGVSDYLQRRYTSGSREIWFYAGFVGGGATGAIHAPAYCLPGSGYELQETRTIALDLPGIPLPTRWKEELWKDSEGAPIYSLHTFLYRGEFEPGELRLRAARALGIGSFTAVNVTGDHVGSLEETRKHYAGLLEKAVPLLVRHLP